MSLQKTGRPLPESSAITHRDFLAHGEMPALSTAPNSMGRELRSWFRVTSITLLHCHRHCECIGRRTWKHDNCMQRSEGGYNRKIRMSATKGGCLTDTLHDQTISLFHDASE